MEKVGLSLDSGVKKTAGVMDGESADDRRAQLLRNSKMARDRFRHLSITSRSLITITRLHPCSDTVAHRDFWKDGR